MCILSFTHNHTETHTEILGLLYSVINRSLVSDLIFSKSSHLQILGDSHRDLKFEFSQREPFTSPYLVRLTSGCFFNVICTRFNSVVRSFSWGITCGAGIVAVCVCLTAFREPTGAAENGVRVLYRPLDKGPLGPGVEQVFGNTRPSSGIYCLARRHPYPHTCLCYALPTYSYPEISTWS